MAPRPDPSRLAVPTALRPRARPRRATPPRGLAVLAVVMLLVLAASLGVLYVNRSVVYEQRTAVSQWQSTQALEVAEAGIEWATGMLNSPYDIGANCAFQTTTNQSFRKRYLLTMMNDPVNPGTQVAPATTVYPGCKLSGGGLACDCPSPPASGTRAASLGSDELPSFTVAFEAVPGDEEAVRITSYGCNARSQACTPTTFATAEGNARVTVLLKLRPLLRAMPAAPLTCGTSCTVGGSFNIANDDVATNGLLVNAGTTISLSNGTTTQTLPGQPAATALVSGDASLSALSSADPTCSNSRMFNAYFGTTIDQYRAAPSTKTLSCGSASDCRTKLDSAYADGWRAFYFDSDLHLSGNSTYGSATDPITLVTPNGIDINGNNTFYGLIFSNSAAWNDLGTGSAVIHGAQVSCAAYRNNGNGTLNYDADALRNARRLTGLMVRVPGSWRDFRTTTDALP